jgi:glycerol-3-phosphate dehydrogenase
MKAEWTRTAALPGGDLPGGDRNAWYATLCARYPALPADLLRGLARRHGARALAVLGDRTTMSDLGRDFGGGLTAREIDFVMDEEWALTADDVLWRRTKCGLPMSRTQRNAVADYCAGRALATKARQ